jgi:hypothetical protein
MLFLKMKFAFLANSESTGGSMPEWGTERMNGVSSHSHKTLIIK